jgi:hypothetical protein
LLSELVVVLFDSAAGFVSAGLPEELPFVLEFSKALLEDRRA